MNFLKKINIFSLQRVIFFMLIAFFISLFILFRQFSKTQIKVLQETEKNQIHYIKKLSFDLEDLILLTINTHKDMYDLLKKNPGLRKKLDSILNVFVDNTIKYIYVIRKDKDGKLRYLLDGSNMQQRAFFDQPFFPVNPKIWNFAFKFKKDAYSTQQKAYGIWITYLHPVIYNNKLQGVIAIDISTNVIKRIVSSITPLRNYLGYMLLFICIVISIMIVQFYLYLKEQSIGRIDYLTRLYNRTYLRDIQQKIDLFEVSVIMVDIDFFKKINDTYGHPVGDETLKSVAKRLLLATRPNDIVIRYGGEEFLVILKHNPGQSGCEKNYNDIIKIAERIRETIKNKPIRVDKLNINITVSVGVDPFTCRRNSLLESIEIADEMLYKAKNNGRDRVEIAEK